MREFIVSTPKIKNESKVSDLEIFQLTNSFLSHPESTYPLFIPNWSKALPKGNSLILDFISFFL